MTENTILSIIVPIYEGEKYIDRCVETIMQEYQDGVELLLINDGSKDSSLQRCNYWKSVYNWIRVLHHDNQGVSYTRNRGIKEACGRYIWFVDVDDNILPGSISSIIEIIKNEKPDILLFGYRSKLARKQLNEFDTNPVKQGQFMLRKDISELFWDLLSRNLIHNIGNKVYLKDMLENSDIKFDERLAIYEDAMFCVNAMRAAERLSVCACVWYCYNLEDNMQSLNHIYRKNYFLGVTLLYENISKLLGKTNELFYYSFLSAVLDVIGNEFRRGEFRYIDFTEYTKDIVSDYKVQQALKRVEHTEELDTKWKKILGKRYYECFLSFKMDRIKRNVYESKMINDLFDLLYGMYKRFKTLLLK